MSKFIREAEEINPNLIPIMNLFTALIPFLLMSAVFFRMSIIQISVPVQSSTGETDIAKEEDKITLNLQIFSDRFELSASSDTLDPKKLSKLQATIKRPSSTKRTSTSASATKALETARKSLAAKITDAAYRIKGNYISSDTVIIVPEDDIAYETIVFAMDAVRVLREDRKGRPTHIDLFGRVVLSSRVK